MNRQELNEFLRHPVSIILKNLLIEHKEALKLILLDSPIEMTNIGVLNQIKGQIITLELVEDLEGFLEEKLTKEVKEEDEEV